MLRLIGIVISIGLADSLNPTTIGPALYLSTGERARERVSEFTVAVFAVYLIGGAAIAFGIRQLIRPLLPHPHHHITDIIELAVGVAMIAGSTLLFRYRHTLADRDPPDFDPHGRSSWLLGASITAVELPTAFPYFAAIAAIVGSDPGPVRGLVLLVLFNFCFVLPLIGIVATLTFGGDQADRLISTGRDFMQRHWPSVLASLALVAGLFVALLGATGIAATHSAFIRHLHHTLHRA
ncbi:MAG TPA: GAP family protein [Solirubrobacteraceae bacterium]|nr:GAP family protein [Solirubrobacteraceae bacterium]